MASVEEMVVTNGNGLFHSHIPRSPAVLNISDHLENVPLACGVGHSRQFERVRFFGYPGRVCHSRSHTLLLARATHAEQKAIIECNRQENRITLGAFKNLTHHFGQMRERENDAGASSRVNLITSRKASMNDEMQERTDKKAWHSHKHMWDVEFRTMDLDRKSLAFCSSLGRIFGF